MFKVFFITSDHNMSYSIETKSKIVILMAKFESPIMVIRELQRQGTTDIPVRQTITSIHQKFLEIGSVQDLVRTGRPSTRVLRRLTKPDSDGVGIGVGI
jgi:hypothetical protein